MISTRRVVLIAALVIIAVSSFSLAGAAVHRVPSYGGGGGHGGGGHDHGGHGGHYYGGYYPYFGFYGYYGPYAYGYYGPYGPYAYGYGYPYPAEEPDFAIIDCDVDPEEAKVYLDGERLGEADDFDGFPNYLTVPTGHHVVEFRRHGFQTLRLEIEVKPGRYYEVDRRLYAGDINGKPRIENWGAPSRGEEPEEDMDAPQPPRTHHYNNEKPRAPKTADPKDDQGDPSEDTGTPEPTKAEARNPNPRP